MEPRFVTCVSVRVSTAVVNTTTKSNLGGKGLSSAYSSDHGPPLREVGVGIQEGILDLFYVWMSYLHVCKCTACMQCPQRPEVASFPGTGIEDVCELPCQLGTKSKTAPLTIGRLSSPLAGF